MTDVLWTCFVCEADLTWLPSHLRAVRVCDPRPGKLLVIDNDASPSISSQVEQENPGWFEYLSADHSSRHLGYNASFNQAVSAALADDAFKWFAVMTVRATPRTDWLGSALDVADATTGMVATLHLTSAERVHGLGHHLSRSGACLDFGFDTSPRGLTEAPGGIWAACAGGALYRTCFLRDALDSISPISHPYGFLSNNCQGLGFLARHVGYTVANAPKAICYRDVQGSNSANPRSPGVLMIREINRITELLTYWPDEKQEDALSEYLREPRSQPSLGLIEKRVAVVLGRALKRSWKGSPTIGAALKSHLEGLDEINAWRRRWKV